MKIETWEHRDDVAERIPCRADRAVASLTHRLILPKPTKDSYAGPYGEWLTCGTWCGECEAVRYCWRCKDSVEAIKAFDDEQFKERQSKRKKAGGK